MADDAPLAVIQPAEILLPPDLIPPDAVAVVSRQLDDLERRVCALPERAMRRAVILENLEVLTAEELVGMLASVLQRVAAGRGTSRELMQEMALEPMVVQDLSYVRIQEAYRIAREAGLQQVAGLFLGAPLQLNPTIDEAFTGNEHLELPLGIRRAAARGKDRFTLDRLLHDRDHRVIALLLDNPRVVERDVVRIAAMRPTRPEVLETIARHRRWSSRYVVRKALAGNPYTPIPLARRLLPTLMKQDVRHLLLSGVLVPELADLARSLVQKQIPGIRPSGS